MTAHEIFQAILAALNPVFAALVCVITAVLAVVAIKVASYLLGKLGISLTSDEIEDVMNTITLVVRAINQKYVNDIKAKSPDGKLTDYQQELIFNKALSIVKTLLSSKQIAALGKKYGADNIDTALAAMIESTVADYHVDADKPVDVVEDIPDTVLNEVDNALSVETIPIDEMTQEEPKTVAELAERKAVDIKMIFDPMNITDMVNTSDTIPPEGDEEALKASLAVCAADCNHCKLRCPYRRTGSEKFFGPPNDEGKLIE